MKRTLGVFAVVVAGAFAFFASQQRFVEAQGRGGNTAAQAFYRSHGFVSAAMTFQRTLTTTAR